MGRIEDEIEEIFDEYEKGCFDTLSVGPMSDEEMRYYWYIRISNLYGGKKPAAE